MVKEQVRNEGGGANSWARVCDTCRAAACTVYCKADAAYLCSACDSRVHAANMVASRHERVWICQACERAPAAFICKADAASLCAACDAEVHSANPLARRHHRVPIMPLYDCNIPVDENDDVNDDDEAASWLLLNPPVVKNGNNQHSNNGYASVDEYLDVVEYNKNSSCFENQFNDQYGSQSVIPDEQRKFGDDSVVPALQFGVVRNRFQQQQQHEYEQEQLDAFHLGLDYDNSKAGYTYNSSLAPSVSHSSIDVSVVPDTSDVSIGHSRAPKGTIDLFSGPPLQMTPQLTPVNREARVLRYREKKKTRKFEKTIRYASRKAYAETRPRIKGRFAKRTDVEVEVDQMFSTTLSSDTGYGIVPSF